VSSFGTVYVVDTARGADTSPLEARLAAAGHDLFRLTMPDGWTRVTGATADVGQTELLEHVVSSAGNARAAVAEDNDEYGALWLVLEGRDGRVRTVHRRYILNADPQDPEQVSLALQDLAPEDPRSRDVAGDSAAAAAARLFGTDTGAMRRAEAASVTAFQELGIVGGPFPWWDALALTWPRPAAGQHV
jgi:hypothetical protein